MELEHEEQEQEEQEQDATATQGRATYSPEDNKIRLYPDRRLSPEDYQRVKGAGFSWAPRQELFVAPAWSPEREDIALWFAGEIDDEDQTLEERAAERADRFEGYASRRAQEAKAHAGAADRIGERFCMGQPILVGHHSEGRARRDAAKIEANMAACCRKWETAAYWEERAKSSISHARYRELPGVRHRRIKKLEADARKMAKEKTEAEGNMAELSREGITDRELAAFFYYSNYDLSKRLEAGSVPGEERAEIVRKKVAAFARYIERQGRWLTHYNNRLAYERAMLADAGGIAADAFNFEVGGRASDGREWFPIIRVNRANGAVNSLTVAGRFVSTLPIERVRDYRPPTQAEVAAVKAATAKPPLLNYRNDGEEVIEMSMAQWKNNSRYDLYQTVVFRPDGLEPHRRRVKREGCFTANPRIFPVFVTDAPTKSPKATTEPAPPRPKLTTEFDDKNAPAPYIRPEPSEAQREAAKMREAVAAGVEVVSAPQLFPTPPALAARMVEELGQALHAGGPILEPSAGTGNLIRAILDAAPFASVHAIELSPSLAGRLSAENVRQGDFLGFAPMLKGSYSAVIMNPPFKDAADIAHIQAAFDCLERGGRLVALCANGPRQRARLLPWVEEKGGTWEDLPAGSFAEAGTGVNVALIVVDA
jgi:phospholipid N-methyltransferase